MIVGGCKGFRDDAGRAPEPDDSASADRRSVLRLLGGALGWLLVGDRVAPAAAAIGGRTAVAPDQMREVDRRAARLGRRFALDDARSASQLVREAHDRLGSQASALSADRARHLLLNPQRLASEWEKDDTLLVDGWLLARSEVALCVYLYELSGRVIR